MLVQVLSLPGNLSSWISSVVLVFLVCVMCNTLSNVLNAGSVFRAGVFTV